ncbi:NUDIX domain-containing protein [Haloferula sp. A504]|uniref:NUDIX domain-containing protein n=1 Tax=Haloferula sp. A504 TaxID=3373601 RepID=UPI0031C35AB2|nr:NUDIX domain-containing protein [Verrucomicrobiaceae bacterium E54]
MKHSASILVRDPEGLILILERGGTSRHFLGMWEFPGGKIDEGQTASEAARREAEEEAGLVIPELPGEPEKVIVTNSREVEYSMFCHDFTDSRPEVTLSDEHSAFRWVTPVELQKLAREDKVMPPHLEFFSWNWLRRQIEVYATDELPRYKTYAGALVDVLNKLRSRWAPLAIVQARPKAVDSFAGKCLRKADKYSDPVHDLTDLCGGRMIAPTEREAELICRQIREVFEIEEDDDTAVRHARDAFGYLSVHFLVRIPMEKDGSSRVKSLLGVTIPEEIGDRVAEIQVRTLLQHAHSEVTHDRLYKSGFKPPTHCEREAARVAAALESADAEFGRFVAQVDAYVGEYAAQMDCAERNRRIEDQCLLIELEPDPGKKAKLALGIAHLARSAWDWETLIEALDAHAGTDAPCAEAIRMELGHALCRMHQDKPKDPKFRQGLELLQSVAQPDEGFDAFLEDDDRIRRATALGWLGRVLIGSPGSRALARRSLQGAVQLVPEDPYHLCGLVELEVIAGARKQQLDLLAPSLRAAAQRCKAHIEAGIEVNRAWLALTRIRLFLGDDGGAFEALCLAARSSENPRPMADIRRSLERLEDAMGEDFPMVAILECAADLFAREAELGRQGCDRSSWNSQDLHPLVEYDADRHALIIAGATGEIDAGRLSRFDAHLRAALAGCDAQVLSGGTDAGVCGLLAKLAREDAAEESTGGSVHGYIPEHLPPGTRPAGEPVVPVKTPGAGDFTIHEPLQMWTDLLASGVDPAKVVLLCLGGGKISAAELALAWALGAKAAVIDDESEAAERFKELLDHAGEGRADGMLVPDDVPTLSAMLCFRSAAPDSEWEKQWEEPGKAVHQAYLLDQSQRIKEPNLRPWARLTAGLKHSNRHQAFYAAEILRSHGFTVEKSELPPEEIPVFKFADTDEDKELIESMAEAEHGRWNAERLHDGWRHGEKKDTERKISPYLVPWSKLPDDIKGYDRNAVHQWPKILAKAGWVVG